VCCLAGGQNRIQFCLITSKESHALNLCMHSVICSKIEFIGIGIGIRL
jgi:hypothetical protein